MKSFSKLLTIALIALTAAIALAMDENPTLTGGPTGDSKLEAPKNPVEEPATSGRAFNDTELAAKQADAPAFPPMLAPLVEGEKFPSRKENQWIWAWCDDSGKGTLRKLARPLLVQYAAQVYCEETKGAKWVDYYRHIQPGQVVRVIREDDTTITILYPTNGDPHFGGKEMTYPKDPAKQVPVTTKFTLPDTYEIHNPCSHSKILAPGTVVDLIAETPKSLVIWFAPEWNKTEWSQCECPKTAPRAPWVFKSPKGMTVKEFVRQVQENVEYGKLYNERFEALKARYHVEVERYKKEHLPVSMLGNLENCPEDQVRALPLDELDRPNEKVSLRGEFKRLGIKVRLQQGPTCGIHAKAYLLEYYFKKGLIPSMPTWDEIAGKQPYRDFKVVEGRSPSICEGWNTPHTKELFPQDIFPEALLGIELMKHELRQGRPTLTLQRAEDDRTKDAHIMCCIGFETVNGITRWEVINSWGTSWGEGGYGFTQPINMGLAIWSNAQPFGFQPKGNTRYVPLPK